MSNEGLAAMIPDYRRGVGIATDVRMEDGGSRIESDLHSPSSILHPLPCPDLSPSLSSTFGGHLMATCTRRATQIVAEPKC
jgi:hypothetical protein